MKIAKLTDMKKGWFIGDFEPSLFKTEECEVAVKCFKKGEYEAAHFHKIATEFTVVNSGKISMFNKEWITGDIIIAEPGDVTSFLALTDSVLTVVKIPGAKNDKYLLNDR